MKRFLFIALLPMLLVGCDNNNDNKSAENLPKSYQIISVDEFQELVIIASFTDQEDAQAIAGWEDRGMYHSELAQILSGNYIPGSGAEYNFSLDIHTAVGCMPSPIHKATYQNLFLIFDPCIGGRCIVDCTAGCIFKENAQLCPEQLTEEKLRTLDKHIRQTYFEKAYYGFTYWFCYATMSQIRIKADKDLWGIKAGEDVSDKFRILAMQDLMLSYPDFEIAKQCGEMPAEKLSELKGLMMKQCPICIKMADVPSEIYDKVEFTIEVDVMLPDDKVQTISNKVAAEFEY